MEIKVQPDWAMEKLLSLACAPETEEVPLLDALRRVSAVTVTARLPNPPFARSAYDGFALLSTATADASADAPAMFRVHGELPAGSRSEGALHAGCAVKILTGAPVPEGADAVVAKERAELNGDTLLVPFSLKSGENVASIGEDVAAGDILVKCGDVLDPARLGLLAGQGMNRVSVCRVPRIALISTGSELIQTGALRKDAQIYDTNLFTVGGYIRQLGAALVDGGIVRDDKTAVAEAISRALDTCDAVFLTGGASVGDYDFSRAAMEALGGEMLFWKIAMKPGGAMVAARIRGKAVIGLSGNPGAAAMGLLRIAAPFVKKLCGKSDVCWPAMSLRLKADMHKASPQTRLLRGRLQVEDGQAYFQENGRQHNGAVSSFADCDLIAEIPAGSAALSAGTAVKAFVF